MHVGAGIWCGRTRMGPGILNMFLKGPPAKEVDKVCKVGKF